jgi:hypothetical protein
MKNKTSITETEILKKWVKFYLLTDLFTLLAFLLAGPTDNLDRFQAKFISAVFFAPVFETLLVQLPLVVGLTKLKLNSKLIIFITTFIFAFLHIGNGISSAIVIFYPLLIMTWCFHFYYTRCNLLIALFFTIVLHSVYNFTSLLL